MKTRERVAMLVQEHEMARIGEKEWLLLREQIKGVSEATIRKHLVELQIPIEQPWRGIDAGSLDSLAESLCALGEFYPADPRGTRELVIKAKDKARFASRNPKVEDEKRALKAEMVEWMLVWLGDPRIFSDWVKLRLAVLREQNPISSAKQIQP